MYINKEELDKIIKRSEIRQLSRLIKKFEILHNEYNYNADDLIESLKTEKFTMENELDK